jgi:PST family polysaccharide transporter
MRLLKPADFGIVAMAEVVMPYFRQLTAFGIFRTVVVCDLTEEQLAQLHSINCALSLVAFSIVAVLATPISIFFRAPRLAAVLMVTGASLIPFGLGGIPGGLLAREKRFRFLSLGGVAATFFSTALTLVLAFWGFGYWALVIGNAATSLGGVILVLCARPVRFARPRWAKVREALRFARRLTLSNMAVTTYQRTDDFVAGRTLGQSALGFYGTAWALVYVPLDKIVTLVLNVLPSYMRAVREQPAALRRYLRISTEGVAMAAIPATVGLGLVAPEFIPLVFGHKWDPMIAPLEVLSCYAAVRSLVAFLPMVLTVVGDVRFVMWNEISALIILPVAFYLGSHYGTVGIAWAWVWAYPLVYLPLYYRTFQSIHMKLGEYLRGLRPAFEATAAMTVAVELVKHSLSQHLLLPKLGAEIIAGASVYSCILWLRHKERVRRFIEIARGAWRDRTESKAGVAQ